MIGVIPAAGRGTRAYPYSRGIPKGMIEVAGKPSLERIVTIMRDKLAIRRIVIVIGPYGEQIRTHFGDGASMGVLISYMENDAVERGLGYSLLLVRPHVDDRACVMLSDECYVESNHEDLLATDYRRYVATCAVQRTQHRESIEKNYAVYAQDGVVTRIVEKPGRTDGALLGLGTLLVGREFFEALDVAVNARQGGPSDPISVLGRLCAAGAPIAAVELRGLYVNINDRDALNRASNAVRAREFDTYTRGLALLMKGSAEQTRRALSEFGALDMFDQLVLVTPPGAPDLTAPSRFRCVTAASSRYGDVMRAGLDALDTDILVCAHSDGSCQPRDVAKFLEYLKEADLVVGTRTTRQLVEQGTNMRGIIRLAHVVLAKVLEIVWWGYEPRFTDVGCSYRAIWRSTYSAIRSRLRRPGPEYSVEMFLEVLKCRRRVIEIPVNFSIGRKGVKEPDQTLRTFLSIAALIVRRRVED